MGPAVLVDGDIATCGETRRIVDHAHRDLERLVWGRIVAATGGTAIVREADGDIGNAAGVVPHLVGQAAGSVDGGGTLEEGAIVVGHREGDDLADLVRRPGGDRRRKRIHHLRPGVFENQLVGAYGEGRLVVDRRDGDGGGGDVGGGTVCVVDLVGEHHVAVAVRRWAVVERTVAVVGETRRRRSHDHNRRSSGSPVFDVGVVGDHAGGRERRVLHRREADTTVGIRHRGIVDRRDGDGNYGLVAGTQCVAHPVLERIDTGEVGSGLVVERAVAVGGDRTTAGGHEYHGGRRIEIAVRIGVVEYCVDRDGTGIFADDGRVRHGIGAHEANRDGGRVTEATGITHLVHEGVAAGLAFCGGVVDAAVRLGECRTLRRWNSHPNRGRIDVAFDIEVVIEDRNGDGSRTKRALEVVDRDRGVVDRSHLDVHGADGGSAGAVVDPVGERVGPREVRIRHVDERTVAVHRHCSLARSGVE